MQSVSRPTNSPVKVSLTYVAWILLGPPSASLHARRDGWAHHVNILEMNGDSYRLASNAKRQKQGKGTAQEEPAMT